MKSKTSTSYHQKGFTLIELLVVVAIIGLLASIITVALNSARIKARDARRLSDMKQVKSGLDLYFSTGSGYPSTATWNATVGSTLNCSGTALLRIPSDPFSPNFAYTYTAAGGPVSGCGVSDEGLTYTITFVLEKTGSTYTMDQDGQFSPALPNL